MEASDTASGDTWSLSVKAIGSTLKDCTNADSTDIGLDSTAEKNFTVTVSPDDSVTELYDKIETATGLKASQQRLIYRGRLIDNDRLKSDTDDGGGGGPTKIGDIVGLNDGHTIHLVKRQENAREQHGENNANSSSSSSANASSSASPLDRDDAGNGTASLLAALIGLGGLDDDNDTPSTGRQRWRSGRLGRSRRPHYRLTADDLQTSDPGTLEPVRQGLMTIHTMLPHAQVREAADVTPSPLAANRRWYRGQWIDVRDTVNQWLEATIVDIIAPQDVLPPREIETKNNKPEEQDILEPATDPAVSAGDLEGRRRLLLEPCDAGDAEEEGGELAGFRRRTTNAGVQLLLIHYNGWPHRWDEWIRSDSERIRPFRTRTRHPNMATHSSPTTQSAFNESPPTHITDDDSALERPAILPELSRAVAAVNELLTAVAAEESAQVTEGQQENLPWALRASPSPAAAVAETNVCDVDDHDLDELPPLSGEHENLADLSSSHHSNTQPRLRRHQLQMLAPLLDRLGRTLVDAAPHVAALAQASPDHDTEESISTAEAVVAPQQPAEENNPSTLGGLLSLLSRDRRRQNASSAPSGNDAASASNEQPWPVDPDYVDFATGSVNTTRGEVRSGPRSRSNNDDVAGLLGAYLAAASLGLNTTGGGGGVSNGGGDPDNNDDNASNVLGLGRLLRDRGGNGGGTGGAGIDIHIHAVVTAPGMPPTAIGGGTAGGGGAGGGGLGFATLGGPPATPTAVSVRNSLSPSRERRGSGGGSLLRLRTPTVAEEEEDDLGLFSDLYSESPEPVDPNGSPQLDNGRRDSAAGGDGGDFLSRLGPGSSRTSAHGTSERGPVGSSPARLSRTSSDTSSRRSSNNGSSPRRGSMLGRLFRRSRRHNS